MQNLVFIILTVIFINRIRYWQFKLAMRDLVVDKRTNQYGYRWASRRIVYTILKPDAHSVTQ